MNLKAPGPVIGLTCYSGTGSDWTPGLPTRRTDFVFCDYPRGVEAAGGVPLLVPLLADADTAPLRRLLERLDGLILTGGLDVLPRYYGEDPIRGLQEVNQDRDRLELALVREAMSLGRPILGICRGLQLINVALGGTLYQDIGSQAPGVLEHQQKASRRVNTHRVTVASESRLRSILEAETVWVNSHHHQAVKDVADGLTVSAKAPDGMVEALEMPDYPFLLAVQWHPEGTWPLDPYSKKLFSAFVEAARLD